MCVDYSCVNTPIECLSDEDCDDENPDTIDRCVDYSCEHTPVQITSGPTGGTSGVIWSYPPTPPEQNETEENETEETTEKVSGGCIEDWECGDWSECFEGVQIRDCVDLNKCGTVSDKPSESQFCEVVEGGEEEPLQPTGLFTLTPEEIGGASLLGLIIGSLMIWFFSRRGKK